MNQEDTNQSQNVTLATIVRDIYYISLSISELKQTLATLSANYLSRAEFTAYLTEQAKAHEAIESRLRTQEKSTIELQTQIRTWLLVGGTVFAVVQSVVTAVIIKLLV